MGHLYYYILTEKYSIRNVLIFDVGPNGFIYHNINNDGGSARIFLHGAHIISFVPLGQESVIFVSSEVHYQTA